MKFPVASLIVDWNLLLAGIKHDLNRAFVKKQAVSLGTILYFEK